MLRDRLRIGAIAGFVAAAATAGAMLGFGLTRGSAWRPINTVAHLALGYRAEITDGLDPLVTPVGIVVHIASLLVWGVLFAFVAARLRAVPLVLAALLFAGGIFLLDHRVLPIRWKPGFELVLSVPELLALYLVMALSLVLGITLARRHDAR